MAVNRPWNHCGAALKAGRNISSETVITISILVIFSQSGISGFFILNHCFLLVGYLRCCGGCGGGLGIAPSTESLTLLMILTRPPPLSIVSWCVRLSSIILLASCPYASVVCFIA